MSESVKIEKNYFSSTPWNPISDPWESPRLQFWDLCSGLSAAEVSSSSFFFFFYRAGMWLSHYSIWTQGCCGGMQGYKPHLHTRPHAGHLNGLARIMKLHPEPAWDCLSLSRVDHWLANPDIFTAWWIICSDETAETVMFITCNKESQNGSITYQLFNSSPIHFEGKSQTSISSGFFPPLWQ